MNRPGQTNFSFRIRHLVAAAITGFFAFGLFTMGALTTAGPAAAELSSTQQKFFTKGTRTSYHFRKNVSNDCEGSTCSIDMKTAKDGNFLIIRRLQCQVDFGILGGVPLHLRLQRIAANGTTVKEDIPLALTALHWIPLFEAEGIYTAVGTTEMLVQAGRTVRAYASSIEGNMDSMSCTVIGEVVKTDK